MPAAPLSRVVVDTNVDLGASVEDVEDACTLIRRRLPNARFLLAPTARQELAHLVLHGESVREGRPRVTESPPLASGRCSPICGFRVAVAEL